MKYALIFLFITSLSYGGKKQGVLISESYTYDFSTSDATSSTPHVLATLPAKAVIKGISLYVSTAVSPSAMSVDVGNDADADGYLGTLVGSSLTSGTVVNAEGQDSPLLWDGTNDHFIEYPLTTAARQVLEVEFDNDPTQGVFDVQVEYYIPPNAN